MGLTITGLRVAHSVKNRQQDRIPNDKGFRLRASAFFRLSVKLLNFRIRRKTDKLPKL